MPSHRLNLLHEEHATGLLHRMYTLNRSMHRLIDAQEQVFDGNVNDIDFSTFDNMINEQRKKSITFIKDSLLNHKGGNN